MAETVRAIISKLNEPPFNKSYTLHKFDEINNLQLLQLLNDVLAELDEQHRINLKQEPPEDTAIRMLTFLKQLQYKPKTDNVSAFRQGLVQGHRDIVYPILYWILERLPELKKRAYLARYLKRIEVPEEFLQQDEAMSSVHTNYLALLEDFTQLHKTVESLRRSGFNVAETKREIASMEEEKDQLIARTQKMKKKLEHTPNLEAMMEVASSLRAEKEKEEELQRSIREQKNMLLHAEHKYQTLQQQLKEIKTASLGGGAEGLLARLQEENEMNRFLVSEKLPKALGEKKKRCEELQRILNGPQVSEQELTDMHDQIQRLNRKNNSLTEKRMAKNDPIDDKLSVFRQQASIIARKKEATADDLKEVMDEVTALERELREKQDIAKGLEGSKMLKGDEFKKYVSQLRQKSNVFKKKKAELAEVRAEFGILSRTEELLKQDEQRQARELKELENRKGVSGFQDAQETLEKVSSKKSEIDEQKGKTLNEISDMVKNLMASISEKKTRLAPIIKELRAKRTRCQDVEAVYQEKKTLYNNTAAGLDSHRSRQEAELRGLREEAAQEESRYHYLSSMCNILEIQLDRINDEMKTYMSNAEIEPGTKKNKSFREMYNKRTQEQENLGKMLREKQKMIRQTHEPNMRQLQMWNDLGIIMQCKLECMQKDRIERDKEFETIAEQQDHLVL